MEKSLGNLLYPFKSRGLWIFCLFSVFLFSLEVWAPWVFYSSPYSQRWEATILQPQAKPLLWLDPPFRERWLDPFQGFLTDSHRGFLVLLHGGFGWIVGRWVFELNDWWLTRMAWLTFSFLLWLGIQFLFGAVLRLG